MELKYKVEYFTGQGHHDGFNYLTNCRFCRKGFKRGELRFSARVQVISEFRHPINRIPENIQNIQ